MSITQALADAVPIWLVIGSVAVGGWVIEHESTQDKAIAVVEAKAEGYEQDVREIKASVLRIEERLYE